MADSAVAITAGAGTNVDTRTEATNGNHRQVIVLGDPSTNAGVAPVDATLGLSVQVTATVPGTAATNLGKAEDAAHTSGDTGVMLLAVRNDSGTALAGSSGDYIPLMTNSNGSLNVATGLTEYTEGDTDASISGSAILWEDTSDTLRSVSAAKPLPIVQTGALPAGGNTIGAVDIASALPAGSNNIGDVDLASALPAGTNLIGQVSASCETATIYNGTTALTPKFAIIDAATSGDNTLVAAVTAKKIRVHSLFMVASAAVTVRLESGAGGTALTGQMNLASNGGFVLPFNPVGWFETGSNTLLNLELSGATSVDGSLQYTEV